MKWDVSMMGPRDAGRWHFFVNGERVMRVIEADDEENYVIAHDLKDGRPYLNEDKSAVVTVRLEGRVQIIDTRPTA